MQVELPKKRGRKPKNASQTDIKCPKNRGRKPKGGKIIQTEANNATDTVIEPNIILHLKCGQDDLNNKTKFNLCSSNSELQSTTSLGFQYIDKNSNEKPTINSSITDNDDNETKPVLWDKLQQLANNLHTNNISDKKSACHWCTEGFDNPPIFIPKYELKGSYFVYGCFCSPECACAYLYREDIDSSAKFERYHFLNLLYCKIYDYKKNIKPAPNPYYTLNKFYGNLSIQEYRQLLKSERLLLIIDKPLTRILPELHEDNDDLEISNQSIFINNKFALRKKTNKVNKNNILKGQFGNK